MLKKIGLIAIISFANVGTGKILYQNNGFFILILTCLCFWIQMKCEPFLTEELNTLDLKASLIMIITIFGGLFSSICENYRIQIFLMAVIMLINVYFFISFLKTYILIKICFAKDSKFIIFLKTNLFEKYWNEGFLCYYFLYIFYR